MDVIHGMEENFTKAAALAGETVTMALAVSKAALPMNAAHLVQIANQISQTAEDTFASRATVLRAADRLSRVEDSARSDAVNDLVLESVALAQEAGNAGNDTLMRNALSLASAGRCYLRLAALHETDGAVTKQPSQANELPNQVNGPMGEQLWGLRWTGQIASWWSRRKRMEDVEALIAPFLVPTASLASASTSSNVPQGQGKLCDRWLGMQTCTLAMSLSLLPYMGRDSLLKDKEVFSDDYLWWVDVFFKVWWGMVAISVPCSLYGRGWIAQQYARLSSHLGILGLTVLVGYFSSWILSIKATYVLTSFLGITVAGFVLSFISCCAKGDL